MRVKAKCLAVLNSICKRRKLNRMWTQNWQTSSVHWWKTDCHRENSQKRWADIIALRIEKAWQKLNSSLIWVSYLENHFELSPLTCLEGNMFPLAALQVIVPLFSIWSQKETKMFRSLTCLTLWTSRDILTHGLKTGNDLRLAVLWDCSVCCVYSKRRTRILKTVFWNLELYLCLVSTEKWLRKKRCVIELIELMKDKKANQINQKFVRYQGIQSKTTR